MTDEREPPESGPRGAVPPSRWALRIAGARRRPDLGALLAHPHALALVRAMPVQDLYFLVKRTGLADSLEVLELAHPRQVQGFIDLDAWSRDRLEMERFYPWLEALLATSPSNVSRMLDGLDPEVWVIFLQRHVRAHTYSLEQWDSFSPDDLVLESPDHLFLVEVLHPTSRGGELATRLIQHLFKTETPEVWRRFLEATRVEIAAEVEEEALRFRRARLEDLGFVAPEEAVSLFAYLNPRVLKEKGPPTEALPEPGALAEGEGLLPAPFADPLEEPSFLSRVLARIDDESVLDALGLQIVVLANRALIAEEVDMGEEAEVRASVARMRNYISIALEYLGDGDIERAGAFLLGTPLARLYQAGFSLTLDLRYRTERFLREGWPARRGARLELLEAREQELLRGLVRPRPVFFAGLAEPARIDHRDFETLADVEQASERLDLVELQGHLMLDALGLDPLAIPRDATFSTMFRCAFVHLATGNGFRFDPVTLPDLQRFLDVGMTGGNGRRRLGEEHLEEAMLFLDGRLGGAAPGVRTRARALATEWLARLEEELGGLESGTEIDPRFVGGLWIVG